MIGIGVISSCRASRAATASAMPKQRENICAGLDISSAWRRTIDGQGSWVPRHLDLMEMDYRLNILMDPSSSCSLVLAAPWRAHFNPADQREHSSIALCFGPISPPSQQRPRTVWICIVCSVIRIKSMAFLDTFENVPDFLFYRKHIRVRVKWWNLRFYQSRRCYDVRFHCPTTINSDFHLSVLFVDTLWRRKHDGVESRGSLEV